MNEDAKAITMGLFTLAVLVLVGSFSFRTDKVNAADHTEVMATFGKINGLSVGDEVRMSGIKIGEVSKVTLTDKYQARVRFKLDTGIQIPTDTAVAIHTESIFGSKYVTFSPGAEEEYMETGDTFDFAQSSVDVQEIMDLIIGQAKANRDKIQKQLEALKK